MTRSSPPARSEVAALLEKLAALGVDVPPDAVRALQLAEAVERLAAPPDVAGWVQRSDLFAISGEDVMVALRRSVVQLQLAAPAGRGLLREAVDALTARAVAALAADAERLIDALRPSWDTAAGVVAAAAATGITSASTAADAIKLGDDAAAAWRTLAPALAVLDRLHRLRNTLLSLTGREHDDDRAVQPRWLDRSVAGPVPLTTRQEASA